MAIFANKFSILYLSVALPDEFECMPNLRFLLAEYGFQIEAGIQITLSHKRTVRLKKTVSSCKKRRLC